MNTERQLPRYRCHKIVWALKIKSVSLDDGKKVVLTPEEKGYEPLILPAEYYEKHYPVAGGYYVQYEDGYQSFSPPDAFEKGYWLIDSGAQDGESPFHPAVSHVLKYFEFDHLPEHLQVVSREFYVLAHSAARRCPASAETTVALRKLLEAKDAAVRAVVSP